MYKVKKKFISTHGDNGQEYAVDAIIEDGTLPDGYVNTLKKLGFLEDSNSEIYIEDAEDEIVDDETVDDADDADDVEDETVDAEDDADDETVDDILAKAKEFKTKDSLEEFAMAYGIDLNKQRSMKNMIVELKEFLKSK